jgi:hypothetical protein
MKLRHAAALALTVLVLAGATLFLHYRLHAPFWAFIPGIVGGMLAVLLIRFQLWRERLYVAEIQRRIDSAN